MSKVIHVAVGVIVGTDQKVLIARRPPNVHQGGLWEFPGGKLETGETVVAALQRELQEELGIEVDPDYCFPLKKILHRYDDRTVLLDTWRIDRFRGEPAGREQQEVRWLPVQELDSRQFPVGNKAIISALQLPGILAITGCAESRAEFQDRFTALLKQGLRLIQFRQHDLAAAEFIERAEDAVRLCREHDARLSINGSLAEFNQVGADGLHVNSIRLLEMEGRPVGNDILFSASCHSLAELEKAEQLGVDFALLSPVHSTLSHPDNRPLGWEQFRFLGSRVNIPVYALGGMEPADLGIARKLGGHGIAAIRAFW